MLPDLHVREISCPVVVFYLASFHSTNQFVIGKETNFCCVGFVVIAACGCECEFKRVTDLSINAHLVPTEIRDLGARGVVGAYDAR